MTEKRSQDPEHVKETENSGSPWANLRSPYLASLGAGQRHHILELAERSAVGLSAWAADYPIMNPARVRPLCLSVAAAAPFCDETALVSTARMSLWVFALDDLFDEERLADSDLDRAADRFLAVAAGADRGTDAGEMARALSDIRTDLSGYPLFAELEQTWLAALAGTIREMQREQRWRQRFRLHGVSRLPTYEAYLDCGRYSIGGPPHVWSALITVGDPSTPAHQAHLMQMEELASTCIRLANDLRSHQKELAEGKINALIILGHQHRYSGHDPAEAEQLAAKAVRDDIGRLLARLERLGAPAHTTSGRPEAAITNIARFVSEFYESHDYHTFIPGTN